VAGVSLVWLLESGIELAKEMACHPANVHEHLKALLPLSAAAGWTGALHLGLRHGKAIKAIVGRAQSAFATAASSLKQPKQSPTPSSPPPTPEKAAAKAAAVAAETEEASDDAPSDHADAEEEAVDEAE
jgi:hypothetical protein